jgi:hypothetical protein
MDKLTQHAAVRMKQRGIREQTLECLFRYGSKVHDHRGRVIVFFDKQARKRLIAGYGQDNVRQLDSQIDAYAVISEDGDVVTVGHRTKRINRH